MRLPRPTKEEAQKLLEYIAALEPSWNERLIAMKEVRGDNPLRLLGILCCYTLESGQHMSVPILPQLLDDFVPAGQARPCPQCHKEYVLAYPGQPYCGNECAAIARGEVRKVTPEVVPPQPETEQDIIVKHDEKLDQFLRVGTSFRDR